MPQTSQCVYGDSVSELHRASLVVACLAFCLSSFLLDQALSIDALAHLSR
jgi:hypothetical protein